MIKDITFTAEDNKSGTNKAKDYILNFGDGYQGVSLSPHQKMLIIQHAPYLHLDKLLAELLFIDVKWFKGLLMEHPRLAMAIRSLQAVQDSYVVKNLINRTESSDKAIDIYLRKMHKNEDIVPDDMNINVSFE